MQDNEKINASRVETKQLKVDDLTTLNGPISIGGKAAQWVETEINGKRYKVLAIPLK